MNYVALPNEIDRWTDCNNRDFEFWYRNYGHECLHDSADFFCQEGYTFSKETSKCFQYVDKASTWREAQAGCSDRSAVLASVPDKDTDSFLHNIMRGNAYVGAERKEGSWIWADGTTWNANYANWEYGSDLDNIDTDSKIELFQDLDVSMWRLRQGKD